MDQNSRSTAIALTILLGLFLQVLFAWADSRESPNQVAVSFAKAYFKLNPSMSEFLCSDMLTADEVDIVEQHIHQAIQEVNLQGFGASWGKSMLYEVETHTISRDADSATIRLTAQRRKSIQPVFAVVAKLFNLGETHTVDETIELTKEEGRWKICAPVFGLTQT